MRSDWALPQQLESPGDVVSRELRDVLLEDEDGPQLAIFSDPTNDFLGLAVDASRDFVRWIQVPLSHLEKDALLAGAQSVRDALLKKTVLVIDYAQSSARPTFVWRSTGAGIPVSVLPRRGLRLPVRLPSAPVDEPTLRLSGAGAAKDGITLAQLGAVASTMHQVFSAIAREIVGIVDPRSVSVYAAQPGSLTVKVHAGDSEGFSLIAARYRDLVRASDDEASVTRIVSSMPRPVVEAFEKHLQAVDKQQAEVLAEWPTGAVFIGHDGAERALDVYAAGIGADPDVWLDEERTHRGYFEGFWRRRPARFEFYDIDSNETFTGNVDRTVTRMLENELAFLTIGRSQRKYLITVLRVSNAAGEVKSRRLLRFSELST